jgi:uncharacterized protein RhaS with RHS repeats
MTGSGLLQLGARFCWPEIGRFITQDPVGDGMNWYGYAGNNPVVYVDPEGESWQDAWETAKAMGSGENWAEGWRVGWDSGYYRAWARGMVLPNAEKVGVEVAKPHAARGLARAGYHFTDKRFTAWGKYSKKLVPIAAKEISGVIGGLMVFYEAVANMIDAAPLVTGYGFAPREEPCP